MRTVWPKVKLGSLCHEITVGHVGPMVGQYISDGIPFLRSQDIRPFRIKIDDLKYIPPEFHRKLKKSALSPGDVVIVRTGYPGTAAVVPKSLTTANCSDLVVIRPSDNIDPWFLCCIFNSTWGKSSVAGKLVGVAQQHFNIGVAREMFVPSPPIAIQRKIAAILSSYDDLIENNERRIKILENMAQNLYREWFVKFRFPGHNKVKMVDSSLGKSPQGWKVKPLAELIDFNPSLSLEKNTDIPHVAMEGLSTDSMIVHITGCRDRSGGSRFQNGDTLFARITPCLENGKTGFVRCLPSDQTVALGSTEFIVMRSKLLSPSFVYLLARSDPFRDTAIKSMSGATGRQRVQIQSVRQYEIPVPNGTTLAAFSDAVRCMFEQVYVLSRRCEALRHTRDLLLPKLISGEVDVSKLDICTEANRDVET